MVTNEQPYSSLKDIFSPQFGDQQTNGQKSQVIYKDNSIQQSNADLMHKKIDQDSQSNTATEPQAHPKKQAPAPQLQAAINVEQFQLNCEKIEGKNTDQQQTIAAPKEIHENKTSPQPIQQQTEWLWNTAGELEEVKWKSYDESDQGLSNFLENAYQSYKAGGKPEAKFVLPTDQGQNPRTYIINFQYFTQSQESNPEKMREVARKKSDGSIQLKDDQNFSNKPEPTKNNPSQTNASQINIDANAGKPSVEFVKEEQQEDLPVSNIKDALVIGKDEDNIKIQNDDKPKDTQQRDWTFEQKFGTIQKASNKSIQSNTRNRQRDDETNLKANMIQRSQKYNKDFKHYFSTGGSLQPQKPQSRMVKRENSQFFDKCFLSSNQKQMMQKQGNWNMKMYKIYYENQKGQYQSPKISKSNSQMIESSELRYRWSQSDQRRKRKISLKRPSYYSIAGTQPIGQNYSIGPNGDKVFEYQDRLYDVRAIQLTNQQSSQVKGRRIQSAANFAARAILDEHIMAASEIPNDESNPEIITINDEKSTEYLMPMPSKQILNNQSGFSNYQVTSKDSNNNQPQKQFKHSYSKGHVLNSGSKIIKQRGFSAHSNSRANQQKQWQGSTQGQRQELDDAALLTGGANNCFNVNQIKQYLEKQKRPQSSKYDVQRFHKNTSLNQLDSKQNLNNISNFKTVANHGNRYFLVTDNQSQGSQQQNLPPVKEASQAMKMYSTYEGKEANSSAPPPRINEKSEIVSPPVGTVISVDQEDPDTFIKVDDDETGISQANLTAIEANMDNNERMRPKSVKIRKKKRQPTQKAGGPQDIYQSRANITTGNQSFATLQVDNRSFQNQNPINLTAVHSGNLLTTAYDMVKEHTAQAARNDIFSKIKVISKMHNEQAVKQFQRQREKILKDKERDQFIYSNKHLKQKLDKTSPQKKTPGSQSKKVGRGSKGKFSNLDNNVIEEEKQIDLVFDKKNKNSESIIQPTINYANNSPKQADLSNSLPKKSSLRKHRPRSKIKLGGSIQELAPFQSNNISKKLILTQQNSHILSNESSQSRISLKYNPKKARRNISRNMQINSLQDTEASQYKPRKLKTSPSINTTVQYNKLNADSNLDQQSNKEYCQNCGPNMMQPMPFVDMMSNALAVSSQEIIDKRKDAQRYYQKMSLKQPMFSGSPSKKVSNTMGSVYGIQRRRSKASVFKPLFSEQEQPGVSQKFNYLTNGGYNVGGSDNLGPFGVVTRGMQVTNPWITTMSKNEVPGAMLSDQSSKISSMKSIAHKFVNKRRKLRSAIGPRPTNQLRLPGNKDLESYDELVMGSVNQ